MWLESVEESWRGLPLHEWRLRGAPIAFDVDATSAGRALQTHPTLVTNLIQRWINTFPARPSFYFHSCRVLLRVVQSLLLHNICFDATIDIETIKLYFIKYTRKILYVIEYQYTISPSLIVNTKFYLI